MDQSSFVPFRALPANLGGTDFFVGDIHGHFRRLAKQLETVGFDPSKDRLISTGDLVDRGADSDVAADWLEQPFFHAVRGNHEEFYLHWRSKRKQRALQREFEEEVYFRNGGQWVELVSEQEHRRLEALVDRLPYFLTVPSSDGRMVGVVHAELPDGTTWPSVVAQPPTESLLETMTWGRNRLQHDRAQARGIELDGVHPPADENIIPGLDVVVCGHMSVHEPYFLGNLLYLDTGGWRQNGRFSVMRINDVLDRFNQA